MLIAGEPSGDLLAAELVEALRAELTRRGEPPPVFFGAGGTSMAAAGVRIELELTRFAIIGVVDVLRNLWRLRAILRQMLDLACARRPDVIICVDYGGFNRRFAAALRSRATADWRPRIVQYVSPQVWGSRPARARTLARDLDLLISILPIEKPWYAERYPAFPVEYVGHPIIDRHSTAAAHVPPEASPPRIILLPGSRPTEIAHHWPRMVEAAEMIGAEVPVRWVTVFRDDALRRKALELRDTQRIQLETRIGGLSEELSKATLAIASTGTVTLECAIWKVPTVAIYCASWINYQIALRFIRVKYLALPNLLAGEAVMPELLQDAASPSAIAAEARRLLDSPTERARVRESLGRVVHSLGSPGAHHRAAQAVLGLLS